MVINANTKIAQLLKENIKALDAIISINPKFNKLKNPLLRKLMAGRTSLAAASKFGGCTLDDFFQKLEPLGFQIDRETKTEEVEMKPMPAFISSLSGANLVELDVRPVIASGRDPLNLIMQQVKAVKPGQVLKIINTFEPTPLIYMLEKKGFETYVDQIGENLIATYFYKTKEKPSGEIEEQQPSSNDWDDVINKYGEAVQKIDVRQLEMPQPMLTILDAVDHLPPDTALFVYHKRIPVYLLPELREKGFDYRIKEIADGEVHLLIFKS